MTTTTTEAPTGQASGASAGGAAQPPASYSARIKEDSQQVARLATSLALRPLRVGPRLAVLCGEYLALPPSAALGSEERLRRYRQREAVVKSSRLAEGSLVRARGGHREPAGRIRLESPALGQVPRAVRGGFVPSDPESVFVDADFSSAHLAVAAALSGDRVLQTWLTEGDAYRAFALEIARGLGLGGLDEIDRETGTTNGRRLRKAVKTSILAIINGGREATVANKLADVLYPVQADQAAPWLVSTFLGSFRDLARFMAYTREEAIAHRGRPIQIRTPAGRTRVVVLPDEDPDALSGSPVGSLLSARWSSTEAQILDATIARLSPIFARFGGGLSVPLYDGLLLEFPAENAEEARPALHAAMLAAAEWCGVPAIRAEVSRPMASWGG